jgi:hypothetical protein
LPKVGVGWLATTRTVLVLFLVGIKFSHPGQA